ncbi:GM16272 [Drosophila sechellia]|uniref:GM16272 n=1 Tax=Drosophila sechellia TaxID=7238 RepID=B4ILL6_DROSE|nr:GM16272 [Drosophila sechellia]
MFDERENEAVANDDADSCTTKSTISYNGSRHYEEMDFICCAEYTNRIDEAGSEKYVRNSVESHASNGSRQQFL